LKYIIGGKEFTFNSMTNIFYRSSKREKTFLYVSYIINLIIISIFIMLATGVSDIQNETLSNNDLSQLLAIISSVIFVSIITIIFFQWIIVIQFRALFNSRNQFNINIMLIGMKQRKIFGLYSRELFLMQIIAIPIGITCSQVFYGLIAIILNLKENYIPIFQILLSVLLHLIVIVASQFYVFIRIARIPLVNQIRKRNISLGKKVTNKKYILYLLIGLVLLLIPSSINRITDVRQIIWITKLLYFVSFVFLYDFIFLLIHKLISYFSCKRKNYKLLIANKVISGQHQKVKTVTIMMIFSVTLFIGLQMLYILVRNAGAEVINNLNYEGIVTWDVLQENKKNMQNVYYGYQAKTKTESGTNIYLTAIDMSFVDNYEKIDIAIGDKSAVYDIMNGNNINGIILPEFYITKNDVGSEVKIEVEGKIINFIVQGGYYANDFSKLICYTNIDYLNNHIDINNKYNIAYLKDVSNDINYFDLDHGLYKSKEQIKEESYQKAVGGTDLIEMIAIIVVICSIISLVNFFIISAGKNNIDIARFRSIGITPNNIMGIYLIYSIFPIVIASVFIIPFSYLFSKIGSNAMLASKYFTNLNIQVPFDGIIVVISMFMISVIAQAVCAKKTAFTEYFVEFLKDTSL